MHSGARQKPTSTHRRERSDEMFVTEFCNVEAKIGHIRYIPARYAVEDIRSSGLISHKPTERRWNRSDGDFINGLVWSPGMSIIIGDDTGLIKGQCELWRALRNQGRAHRSSAVRSCPAAGLHQRKVWHATG